MRVRIREEAVPWLAIPVVGAEATFASTQLARVRQHAADTVEPTGSATAATDPRRTRFVLFGGRQLRDPHVSALPVSFAREPERPADRRRIFPWSRAAAPHSTR